MPAGRPPLGPPIVDKLEGAPDAKLRLETVLETIAGQISIDEACARLGIKPARFHVIRDQALQAAVSRLEPKPSGRPRKQISPEAQQIRDLEEEVSRLKQELSLAELRAHTDLILSPTAQPTRSSGGKKTNARRSLPRRGRRRKKARSRNPR